MREILTPFRTSNPMWLKVPASYRNRLGPSWERTAEAFLDRIVYLRDRLTIESNDGSAHRTALCTGSATDLPFADGSFDNALTSPPYATRIDYVKGTLPELIVLGLTEPEIHELRRRTTGTPVVSGVSQEDDTDLTSSTGRKLVDVISKHTSKGSARYYAPWMKNYLSGLEAGLFELDRVVSRDGTIAVVVQDSFYKTQHVNLQRIVAEAMSARGRKLVKRDDFQATNLRSRMNPRASRHLRQRENEESVMMFR